MVDARKTIKDLGGRLIFASTKYAVPWLLKKLEMGLQPENIAPLIKILIKLGIGRKETARNQALFFQAHYKDGPGAYELRWALSEEAQERVGEGFDSLDRKGQFSILLSEWSLTHDRALFALMSGDLRKAEELYVNCLGRADQLDADELRAQSFDGLKKVAQRRNIRGDVKNYLEEAVKLRGKKSPGEKRELAMLQLEEGEIPQAERALSEIIQSMQNHGDMQSEDQAVEYCQCLMDRVAIRRNSLRIDDALADLEECERAAARLSALLRRPFLWPIYDLRVRLLGLTQGGRRDLASARAELEKFRKLGALKWMTDELDAELAAKEENWRKSADLHLAVAMQLSSKGFPRGVATCHGNAGRALLELGDLAAAEKYLGLAYEFFDERGPDDLKSDTQLHLARLALARGEHDRAWETALQALDLTEKRLRRFRVLEEQQRFLSASLRFYDRAFEIGWAKGGIGGICRAWSIAERAKSFYLCQLVANADVPFFEGVDETLVAEFQRLERETDILERSPGTREEAGAAEIQRVSRERASLLARIMADNPRWAAVRKPPEFDVSTMLRELPKGTAPLGYFWRQEAAGGARLFLFYCDSELTPRCEVIEWTSNDISKLEACRTAKVDFFSEVFPSALSEKVLPETVRTVLVNFDDLLISPHDHLRNTPFHAMALGPDSCLIDRWAVQYIPTFALLSMPNKAAPTKGVLALGCVQDGFGGPLLKEVPDELEALCSIWSEAGAYVFRVLEPSQTLNDIGFPAETWRGYEILHFSCHGVFPDDQPFDAALRLGSDAVRASRFFAIDLDARLVLLSACHLGRQAQTHGGVDVVGNEWVGLYIPMLYAGARAMLVSLWEADSRQASGIMPELHRQLAHGLAPSAALQSALSKRRGKPCLWANWYLVGLPLSSNDKQSVRLPQ